MVNLSTEEINLVLTYQTTCLSDGQAANVASAFEKALCVISDGANQALTVDELYLVSEYHKEEIMKRNGKVPKTIQVCAHDIIKQQTVANGEASAVCGWDGNFTYRELDELSTRLAHHLIGLGVGPEVVVPLCFGKSAWTIVAMLAVMKAGGAIVFMEPSHPMVRLEGILQQVQSKIVLTSPQYSQMWAEKCAVVIVNRTAIENLPQQVELPHTGVKPSNVLYVIFTSGSTGNPKGCVVEHAAFCSGAIHQGEHSGFITNTSRVLQFASYSFDVSILEIITALMFGACICVPSEKAIGNGIAGVINDMQVSWAFLTPSLVKVVKPEDVPTLRTLVLGGEALTKDEVDTWSERLQLANGYGPSECSIAATCNPKLTRESDPVNIGRPMGGICWIVDPTNHNLLVPNGVAGELLVEGPILARGYLNDPEKTAAVFIENPAFLPNGNSSGRRRLYKTGDLVRSNSDGTINFIGRKDTQAKVRGQRIELGAIEHLLTSHSGVKHAIAFIPASGCCKKRLVAIIALRQNSNGNLDTGSLQLVDGVEKSETASQISSIRQHLSEIVPIYMVPTTWILVRSIPLMVSGKMNRVLVRKWVEGMDDKTYLEAMNQDTGVEDEVSLTPMEEKLREVLSHVLNLPPEQIGPNRSFLNLGGDSISAMQVMSRCRAENMAVSVKDILHSKTISQLAQHVKSIQQSLLSKEEMFDTPFILSPIQQMYFEAVPEGGMSQGSLHYNQSFLLRLTQEMPVQVVAEAIELVVSRHSMLRARFQKGANGSWGQYVMKEAAGSYRYEVHDGIDLAQMNAIADNHQATLEIENGPIFSADLFNVVGDGQILFLVAHHLVVDWVSWRIILKDLEDIMASRPLSTEKPLPFQTWVTMQAEYSSQHLTPEIAFPFEIPPSNYAYWGMDGRINTNEDTTRLSFKLDSDTTSLLLKDCHKVLRTEPLEVFLAALLYSFNKIFPDRAPPTVFREGHGREPWDEEIDLSGTVGWFTTMHPFPIDAVDDEDFVKTLRRVKDIRRRITANGFPYFASRFFNAEGMKAFGGHAPVEVMFDYLGLYQQLERPDALLRQETWRDLATVSDVGKDLRRTTLFEITAESVLGGLQFTFDFNRRMQRQDEIRQWVNECEQVLKFAATQLSQMDVEFSLSDFPLFSLTYADLETLVHERLPQIGIDRADDVEDIYPCTSMQQGLLLSQNKSSQYYQYHIIQEIRSSQATKPIDVERLQNAWQRVVDCHSALRTTFMRSISSGRVYDQVVLKHVTAEIVYVKYDKADAMTFFSKQQPVTFHNGSIPHRLTVCETPTGQILCKIEINHAVIDGASMAVLLKDLCMAYDNANFHRASTLYSEYVSLLQEYNLDAAIEYWTKYLSGTDPCLFPRLNDGVEVEKELLSVKVNLGEISKLKEFSQKQGFTLANVFLTAWGLVLRCYTGSDSVCFGYLASGRDVPVVGIDDAVGAFINMLVCRINMVQTAALKHTIASVQDEFTSSLPHQHCSLAEIQHSLGLSGQALFNTLISFQTRQTGKADTESSIVFTTVAEHDPTEVRSRIGSLVTQFLIRHANKI